MRRLTALRNVLGLIRDVDGADSVRARSSSVFDYFERLAGAAVVVPPFRELTPTTPPGEGGHASMEARSAGGQRGTG